MPGNYGRASRKKSNDRILTAWGMILSQDGGKCLRSLVSSVPLGG